MSSKYREKLLASSGVSNIRFESEYAKKLMTKMGWKEGNGLGKSQHGAKDCIQVRRREDGVGLGKGSAGPTGGWKDDWWNDAYNNSMKKLVDLPSLVGVQGWHRRTTVARVIGRVFLRRTALFGSFGLLLELVRQHN